MTYLPPTLPLAGAVFMDERRHRLYLWRRWSDGLEVMFVGVNPSTANEYKDDPTVRRCAGFAKRWGYGTMFMCNAFTLVSSDPSVLKENTLLDLLHPCNDLALRVIRSRCRQAVVAWGNLITLSRYGEDRAAKMREMLEPVDCFGITQAGQPRHPLYLKNDTELKTLAP